MSREVVNNLSIKYDGDALKVDGEHGEVVMINEVNFVKEEIDNKYVSKVNFDITFHSQNEEYKTFVSFELQRFKEWLFKFFSISCKGMYKENSVNFDDKHYIKAKLLENELVEINVCARDIQTSKDFVFIMNTTTSEIKDLHEMLKRISNMV